ncbi:MAG: isoaspartyl peptidase/L-asparaginase [Pseudomonadota bacterium]
MITANTYALAIHGGAGPQPGRDYSEVEKHLEYLIHRGEDLLRSGRSAIDVVQEMVVDLERSGLYVAGRGTAPNAAGWYEMDASIMDGARGKAGGVAAVRDLENPVMAARAVLEQSVHILLVGEGAEQFAMEAGCVKVTDEESWYRLPVGVTREESTADALAHGTVGAVALDSGGRLAAATSTGGLFGRRAGRIGDSGIIGYGSWADAGVAVSCTGIGESFILGGGAREVASRMRHLDEGLEAAVGSMLKDVSRWNGDGGAIAIDYQGNIVCEFNSPGLKRAWVSHAKPAEVGIF